MLIPDVNLLVYAYNSSIPGHLIAKEWLESCLNGTEIFGISPVVTLGFIRILSNPRIVRNPGTPADLAMIVNGWFDRPCVRTVNTAADYPDRMAAVFRITGASGRLTTDIFLASIALGLDATLCSNDSDFYRIPGLKLFNPLKRQ